jgi:hypothetical protein
MRASLLLLVLIAGCGGAAAPPAPPAATAPGPVMVRIPDGWTDLVHASRDQVEALVPGMYDQAQGMIARNGYRMMAYDLRAGSPDQGSSLTMLALAPGTRVRPGVTIDERFLRDFIADNNLELEPELTVDARIVTVRGRRIAKWRTEYDGAKHRVTTLVYLFADDNAELVELVIIVRAARYQELRPQIEAIEGGDPAQTIILDQVTSR